MLRATAMLIAGLVLLGALSAVFGYFTVETPWLERLLGDNKWSIVGIYLRFLTEHPIYALCLYIGLCVGGVWGVYEGTAGRWRSALWGLLILLLVSVVGIYPFTRAYMKEFKAFTGFAEAIQRQIGPNDPFWFYTPETYSSEFDEFSQVYFYLNRQVRLAPCVEQPNFAQCQPGYYLLRFRHWEKLHDTPRTRLVLDSKDSAGPDPETRLAVVRLGE
jgi:hypothetical protein